MNNKFDPTSPFQQISLVDGTLTYVSTEDFARVNDLTWYFLGGYAATTIGKKAVLLHYYVLDLTERVPGFEVHHVDEYKLNNCRWNLQLLPTGKHKLMHGPRSTNKSGFKGVSWRNHNSKWFAQITHNYKQITIGFYDTKEAAARAYDKKAKELYGSDIYLNFPDEQ